MNKEKQIFDLVLANLEKKDFRGPDVGDVFASRLFLFANRLKRIKKIGKYLYYPFYLMATRYGHATRKIFGLNSHHRYPQAHSIIIRAVLVMHKKYGDDKYVRVADRLFEEMLEDQSPGYEFNCWGQPFDWPSRTILFKAFSPRATVSSQVGMAALDMYEHTGKTRYLEIAKGVCDFYIKDLNQHVDEDQDLCFSYTVADNYVIHNASMLAASVLIRCWKHAQEERFYDFAVKAAQFTAKHQQVDGSWFYDVQPPGKSGVIDNYHTGFVLESYQVFREASQTDFNSVYLKGMKYYKDTFFEENYAPRMRDIHTYPLDIQSAAQSIITFADERNSKEEQRLAKKVLDWTLSNLFDDSGRFYYRIYANGKVDRSSYIRWGESWMLRAIAMVENNKETDV